MQEEMNINPADRELEDALRGLKPAGSNVDPIACAFDAGQASMRKQTRIWRGCSALLLLSVGALSMLRSTDNAVVTPSHWSLLAMTGSPQRVEGNYLEMRNRVLNEGLSAIPELPAGKQLDPVPQIRNAGQNNL